MYHRVRRKMRLVVCAILILVTTCTAVPTTSSPKPELSTNALDNYENNVIDFDDDLSIKFNNRYGAIPWHSNDNKYSKESHRYTIIKDNKKEEKDSLVNKTEVSPQTPLDIVNESTTETDYSVIPLELISTTENYLVSIVESTTDQDLSVIPLSTTGKEIPNIQISQSINLPSTTEESNSNQDILSEMTTESLNIPTIVQTTTIRNNTSFKNESSDHSENSNKLNGASQVTTANPKDLLISTEKGKVLYESTTKPTVTKDNTTPASKDIKRVYTKSNATDLDKVKSVQNVSIVDINATAEPSEKANDLKKVNVTDTTIKTNATVVISNSTGAVTNGSEIKEILRTNSSQQHENVTAFSVDSIEVDEKDVPIFTELDAEDEEVPEDYYDSKDVVPTTSPKANPLSVLVGLAGSVVESVVESVAERVVPKGIYDLFKRMQKQNEQLEAERLRSREENGGLGQFGRGILKSISSGLSKPFTQLVAGAKDIGSLDNDRGFVGSLASGVTSVATMATTLADAFKDRVQAIYPGTVWCGDGHAATARSGELGLFFFTDTCCRQHDACKIYIKAGETKYGLTNTGLFTRSHCSCDIKFRECLRRTNSLVSAQIGLTYFNVLGPQCFRKAHPIVKCVRRTRITGQKCEEYEFDYTKPKMWQWFDNETF